MRAVVLLAFGLGFGWARDPAVAPVWEWHGAVERGKSVEIRSLTGNIRALPSLGDQVDVVAHIDRETEPGSIEIRALESLAGLMICAVRPGSEACTEDTPAAPGARVDYEIRVPSGVHLSARTVNGEIEAQSLAGDVDAATVNGTVTVSTSGTVQAHTVNGSIDASLLKPFWSKSPEFSAVNGRISVKIPTDVHSAVRAETRNGKVVTDIPEFRGTATDQVIDGRIGNAGGCSRMLLRTINGTIELRQRF